VDMPHHRVTSCAGRRRAPQVRQTVDMHDIGRHLGQERLQLSFARVGQEEPDTTHQLSPRGLTIGLHQPTASNRNRLHFDAGFSERGFECPRPRGRNRHPVTTTD
jgi:hypothetical protein